jgi:hypothetical protein
MFLLMIGSLFAANWTMDGDRVYWTQNSRTISAYPATSTGLHHVQFINVSSANPTSVKANFSFVFSILPTNAKAYYWQNVSHPYSIPIYTNVLRNYTGTGNNTTVTFYNESVLTGWNNGTSWYNDWNDISAQFDHTTMGSSHVFTINNVQVNNGNNHRVKFEYDTPMGSSGKFDIYAHSGSPYQAYNGLNGKQIYVALDPWYNSSYANRYPINCTNINSGTPIVINGSSGFTHNGTTQIAWTTCYPNMSLYHNSGLGQYAVANDSGGQVPNKLQSIPSVENRRKRGRVSF